MPQIIPITSEALQATIRRLLPSQRGFGQDLEATNLITPVIDLTPTAEGSELRTDLQTAMGFSDVTANYLENSSTTLVNTPGFYRVFGTSVIYTQSSSNIQIRIQLNDGSSSKDVFLHRMISSSTVMNSVHDFDFTVFLRAGDSLLADSSNTGAIIQIATRQVATVTGELVNPTGFVFE